MSPSTRPTGSITGKPWTNPAESDFQTACTRWREICCNKKLPPGRRKSNWISPLPRRQLFSKFSCPLTRTLPHMKVLGLLCACALPQSYLHSQSGLPAVTAELPYASGCGPAGWCSSSHCHTRTRLLLRRSWCRISGPGSGWRQTENHSSCQ